MEKILDESKCTGCSACYSICPKNAIEMREDQEGFKYPYIVQEKCVNCGLCQKICPVLKEENAEQHIEEKQSNFCIAAYDKDEKNRKTSSSGGIFSKIAEYILKKDGVIFGAGYNEKLEVIHKEAINKEQLEELKRL